MVWLTWNDELQAKLSSNLSTKGSHWPDLLVIDGETWLMQNDDPSHGWGWEEIDSCTMIKFFWKDGRKLCCFMAETRTCFKALSDVVL